LGVGAGGLCNGLWDGWVDQEVLTQGLGKVETVPSQQGLDLVHIT
jgi:hypothetical protein